MGSTAVVFPGQGAQRAGMAMDFKSRFPMAARVFDSAADAVGFDVAEICLGQDARLGLTEYTQPCILTAEIAMLEVLKAEYEFQPGSFGGHSLGEYTALVAAGVMPFEIAVCLVHQRGKLMQEAVSPGVGAMAAVIMDKIPHALVQSLANEQQVDVANDNAVNQVVLSGEARKVHEVSALLMDRFSEEKGEIRIVPLTVSAPFHSRHMAVIESAFRSRLEECAGRLNPSRATRVTSNFTGGFHSGSMDALLDALVRQLSGQVKWRDNMNALISGADGIYEVGPNRPLGGFFRAGGILAHSIVDLRSADRALVRKLPKTVSTDAAQPAER